MSHFTDGRNVTCVWLNGEGGEAAVQGIVLGEAHVNGIFDVPCCVVERSMRPRKTLRCLTSVPGTRLRI